MCSLLYQRNLFFFLHPFYLPLPLLRFTLGLIYFTVDELDGNASASVLGSFARIVCGNSFFEMIGIARVERAIATTHDVDEVGH